MAVVLHSFVEVMRDRFGSRRFITADPDLLDREGVEAMLIGAAHDAEEELGVDLDAESESIESAEIFGKPPDVC